MVIAGIPHEELRLTRAPQEWLAEGRQEGRAAVTIRLLNRRCCPLIEATTAQIQALPLEKLEALLDFHGQAPPQPEQAGPCRPCASTAMWPLTPSPEELIRQDSSR